MKIDDLPKNFEPQVREEAIYHDWMDHGCFHAEHNPDKEPFCIVMPPPNITGQLHIGHALDLTLQDILIRYARLQGKECLYLPGTDHAAIATEVKVVQALAKEGKTKEDLGKEGFLERAWAWRDQYGSKIVEQCKKLGLSCDWSRERFTMDEGLSAAVQKAFVTLYEEGYIYRGNRIINWCPSCGTGISDAEIEYVEEQGTLWYFAYPLADPLEEDLLAKTPSFNGKPCLIVATTRPETIPGDTAVAVNADDERYQHLVGRDLLLPLTNKRIPIVADPYVDMTFGTGCVKITPAHDPNDFEVGERHQLEQINIFTTDGHLNEAAGPLAGMTLMEARKAIIAAFEEKDLKVKEEPLVHNVSTCYRCHQKIEPMLSLQWFVRMKDLAQKAIEVVEDGRVAFTPERFAKQYFHWMNNIRDWCISRQLWWGHPIPAFHCADCGHIVVGTTPPANCPACAGTHLDPDPDTLDTWFSSALWPFSTLGWPEKTEDLEYFFPTNVLVTGFDIITFWVSRMLVTSMHFMDQEPFHQVFIHGLVRDEHGQKMSKSLGNGIDPLEIIRDYGADALRFAVVNAVANGNDTSLSLTKIESGRNFVNKLWNSFRFLLMNLSEDLSREDFWEGETLRPLPFQDEDYDIMAKADALVETCNKLLAKPEPGIALSEIYSFTWEHFCDWYLEMVKPRLRQTEDVMPLRAAQFTLLAVFNRIVTLLHPFMPFVTEEMYQLGGEYLSLTGSSEKASHLMENPWPTTPLITLVGAKEEEVRRASETTERMMRLITEIRNIRVNYQVGLDKKPDLMLRPEDEALLAEVKRAFPYVSTLARVNQVQVAEGDVSWKGFLSITFPIGTVFLELGKLIDIEEEKARLAKKISQLKGQIQGQEKKLQNQSFLTKAPADVVASEQGKLADLKDKLANQEAILETLA